MSTLSRIVAVWKARNLEFLRDRMAMGWNLLLPLLVVLVFGLGFNGDSSAQYQIGLLGTDRMPEPFAGIPHLRHLPQHDLAGALRKVERHQLDVLLDPASRRYWRNDASARGLHAERLLRLDLEGWQLASLSGPPLRYIDWLLPGLLAMNAMFSALWGVGYVLVRYRKNGVLKRLRTTPLTAFEFLIAQVASRLWLVLATALLVFVGTDLLVGFTVQGSLGTLFLVFALGSICLISIGLLIAARITTEELANGLLELVSWPMMFLSGVWFSVEGLHPWLQKLAQLLPLTHIIDAARAVMIDGAGLADIATHLIVLALLSAACLAIGTWTFRWE